MSLSCRGAGSREFIREMMMEYLPSIIVLIEPQINGEPTNVVCKRLGKRKWIRSEAFGFSGGIWVMWDDEVINLSLKQADRFFGHLEVRMIGDLDWEFTAIYVSPNSSIRRHLWGRLDSSEVRLSWALVGDF